MKKPGKKLASRRFLVYRLTETAIIIVLAVAVIYAHRYVWEARVQSLGLQQSIEKRPDILSQQTQLKNDLRDYTDEITAITSLLPLQQDVGNVVSAIEQLAAAQKVSVNVPNIKEEIQYDKENQPVEQTGPLYKIRLDINAAGSPLNLIRFLYSLEHSTYLVDLKGWSLDATPRSLPGFSAPAPDTLPPGQQPPPAAVAGNSLLNASIILTLANEKN